MENSTLRSRILVIAGVAGTFASQGLSFRARLAPGERETINPGAPSQAQESSQDAFSSHDEYNRGQEAENSRSGSWLAQSDRLSYQ